MRGNLIFLSPPLVHQKRKSLQGALGEILRQVTAEMG